MEIGTSNLLLKLNKSSLLSYLEGGPEGFKERLELVLEKPGKQLAFEEYLRMAAVDSALDIKKNKYSVSTSEEFFRNVFKRFVKVYMPSFDSKLSEIMSSFVIKDSEIIDLKPPTFYGKRINPAFQYDPDLDGSWSNSLKFYENN